MSRSILTSTVLSIFLMPATTLQGGEHQAGKIDSLMKDLKNASLEKRQSAIEALSQMPETILPQIEQALETASLEERFALNKIYKVIDDRNVKISFPKSRFIGEPMPLKINVPLNLINLPSYLIDAKGKPEIKIVIQIQKPDGQKKVLTFQNDIRSNKAAILRSLDTATNRVFSMDLMVPILTNPHDGFFHVSPGQYELDIKFTCPDLKQTVKKIYTHQGTLQLRLPDETQAKSLLQKEDQYLILPSYRYALRMSHPALVPIIKQHIDEADIKTWWIPSFSNIKDPMAVAFAAEYRLNGRSKVPVETLNQQLSILQLPKLCRPRLDMPSYPDEPFVIPPQYRSEFARLVRRDNEQRTIAANEHIETQLMIAGMLGNAKYQSTFNNVYERFLKHKSLQPIFHPFNRQDNSVYESFLDPAYLHYFLRQYASYLANEPDIDQDKTALNEAAIAFRDFSNVIRGKQIKDQKRLFQQFNQWLDSDNLQHRVLMVAFIIELFSIESIPASLQPQIASICSAMRFKDGPYAGITLFSLMHHHPDIIDEALFHHISGLYPYHSVNQVYDSIRFARKYGYSIATLYEPWFDRICSEETNFRNALRYMRNLQSGLLYYSSQRFGVHSIDMASRRRWTTRFRAWVKANEKLIQQTSLHLDHPSIDPKIILKGDSMSHNKRNIRLNHDGVSKLK